VLPYRAWALLDIVGPEHAHTMLRQSLHYCVGSESRPRSAQADEPRTVLPRVMDEHHLAGRALGNRKAGRRLIDAQSQAILSPPPASRPRASSARHSEDGFAPAAIVEAIALAANQLILRDAGRTEREAQPGKPVGSVHGDSIGVHAVRLGERMAQHRARERCAQHDGEPDLGAYQVAVDRTNRGGDFLHWSPRLIRSNLAEVKAKDQDGLLRDAEAAIRAKRSGTRRRGGASRGRARLPRTAGVRPPALVCRERGGRAAREKFYRTCSDEFATARPAFRWRYVTALARVTASEYGTPAAGQAEARSLLGV
jgi:hypothetical protein